MSMLNVGRQIFLTCFIVGIAAMSVGAQEKAAAKKFAIALHGGAGQSPKEDTAKAVEASLAKALDIGVGVLKGGGTSLDAVERVINYLEDDPLFNAGRGAVFNAAGQHELDASIMDGKTLGCGGVAAVRTVRHPISLARLVMEKTPHVLLATDGAEKFADEMGAKVERVENSWFSTEKRRQELERAQKKDGKQAMNVLTELQHSTVGCVALDTQGNLAAGTSTGGRTNKKFGRVGDSPIIGAGSYANNATCAISGTGLGEQFIRHSVAFNISARMSLMKQPLKDAVHEVLYKTLDPDDGGLIALGSDGTIVMDYTTAGMARAAADSSGYREIKIGR
ncbi:MAG TPA: isoaspartyl peptidase/L-asparaginase [Pirellulaceae bacterium]|jgi:beta-aspartyl-peptidase (threonine type)